MIFRRSSDCWALAYALVSMIEIICGSVQPPLIILDMRASATSWTVGPKKSRMQLDAKVIAGSWGIDERGDVDTNLANWLLLLPLFVIVNLVCSLERYYIAIAEAAIVSIQSSWACDLGSNRNKLT